MTARLGWLTRVATIGPGVAFMALTTWTPSALLAQEESGGALERPNAVAVFLGGTFEPQERGDGASFTLGVSYSRRLSALFTVTPFGEASFGETEREVILGLAGMVHVVGDLALVVAPLFEVSKLRFTGEQETKGGFRAGALYEVSIGEPYLVAPEAYLDFVDGDVLIVVGASVALEF